MKSILILIALLCSKFVCAADNYSDISTTRYVAGGILSIYPGFGIGHAVQGRYTDKGWIFTTGEAISTAVVISGLIDCGTSTVISSSKECSGKDKMLVGTVGFLGFKIWEIFDAWVIPHSNNKSSSKKSADKFLAFSIPSENGLSVSVKYTF